MPPPPTIYKKSRRPSIWRRLVQLLCTSLARSSEPHRKPIYTTDIDVPATLEAKTAHMLDCQFIIASTFQELLTPKDISALLQAVERLVLEQLPLLLPPMIKTLYSLQATNGKLGTLLTLVRGKLKEHLNAHGERWNQTFKTLVARQKALEEVVTRYPQIRPFMSSQGSGYSRPSRPSSGDSRPSFRSTSVSFDAMLSVPEESPGFSVRPISYRSHSNSGSMYYSVESGSSNLSATLSYAPFIDHAPYSLQDERHDSPDPQSGPCEDLSSYFADHFQRHFSRFLCTRKTSHDIGQSVIVPGSPQFEENRNSRSSFSNK